MPRENWEGEGTEALFCTYAFLILWNTFTLSAWGQRLNKAIGKKKWKRRGDASKEVNTGFHLMYGIQSFFSFLNCFVYFCAAFLIKIPIDFPLSRVTRFQSAESGILSRLIFCYMEPITMLILKCHQSHWDA